MLQRASYNLLTNTEICGQCVLLKKTKNVI